MGRPGPRQAKPWRALIGLLICVTVASACAAATSSPPPLPPTLSRDEAISLFAGAGIEVVEGYTSTRPIIAATAPVSPFRLTASQADNLVRDLAGGGGVRGVELDELGGLAGVPDDAPHFSYLVAAWVSGFDSDGARSARRLMGERDWTHPALITFSHFVLALFVSDMVRGEAPTALAADHEPGVRLLDGVLLAGHVPPGAFRDTPDGAETVCGAVSGWVDSVLTTVFEALKLSESGSVFPEAIVFVWNLAVEIAQAVVVGLIETLGEIAFAGIRTVIAAIATLSMAVALFVPYEVTWNAAPAVIHYAHPGDTDAKGSLTATVSDTNVQWASEIAHCASLAGVKLPDARASGKALAWTVTPHGEGGASITARSDAVPADGPARVDYVTGRESPGDAKGEIDGNGVLVAVEIEHLAQKDLDTMFEALIFGGQAGQLLTQVLGRQVKAIKDKLIKLMKQRSESWFVVEYHRPPSPTRSAQASVAVDGTTCIVGTWDVDHKSYAEYIDDISPFDAPPVISGTFRVTFLPSGTFEQSFFEFRTRNSYWLDANQTIAVTQFTTFNGTGAGRYSIEGSSLAVSDLASSFTVTTRIAFGSDLSDPDTKSLEQGPITEGSRTFSCSETQLMQFVQLGNITSPLAWNRVP